MVRGVAAPEELMTYAWNHGVEIEAFALHFDPQGWNWGIRAGIWNSILTEIWDLRLGYETQG